MCHTTMYHDLDLSTLNLFFDPPQKMARGVKKNWATTFLHFCDPLVPFKKKSI